MNLNCRSIACRHSIISMFVLSLLAVFLLFTSTEGYAAVFTVTNTNYDVSDSGSLRYAIENATSQDVITFDLDYPAIITLDEQLSIDHGLTIQGPGADLLSVSGGGVCRVFYIEDTGESVDISGISIVSGDAGDNHGGGIYNLSDSLTLENCHFSGNHAYYGGGMCNYLSRPTVTNCTFSSNTATYDGGGMHNSSCSPTVTNCTFTFNSAEYGGGMSNSFYSPTLTNCTFTFNSAEYGGGMSNFSSNPEVTNCTFSSNSARVGAGIFNGFDSDPTVTNCILWNAAGGEIYNYNASTPTLSYCVVQSDDHGIDTIILGNVTSADPMLEALADNGGLTLTCALGVGSSAIDAGIDTIVIDETTIEAPDTDQRGHERPWGAGYDIGAYEVDVESFTIIPYWTSGGVINPASIAVFEGEHVDFTISPDISYHIEEIYVDGDSIYFEPVENKYIYTFDNVSADHWLFAIFEPSNDDDDDSTTNSGGDGGCSISALSGIALLLALPLMFLTVKMK